MSESSTVVRRLSMPVLSAAVLGGCGHLNVSMDVLNPDVIRSELDKELIARLLPIAVASTPDSITTDVQTLKDVQRQAYNSLRGTYEAQAASLPEARKKQLQIIAGALTSDFDTDKNDFYSELLKDLFSYRRQLASALAGGVAMPAEPAQRATVIGLLRTWQQRVNQAAAVIERDIRAKVNDAEIRLQAGLTNSLVVTRLRRLEDEEIAAVRSRVTQLSIQNSPLAFAVANADDNQWTTRYNKVLTHSQGGASDVAIKLDRDTGNYMLKGLSFDPADVAAVAAKVTTQALLVATQIAGVPVKSDTPADGTSGKALVASSGALADAQAAAATSRIQDEARRKALLDLANVIVNEQADIGGGDPARKAAVAAIRSAFENRRALVRSTNP